MWRANGLRKFYFFSSMWFIPQQKKLQDYHWASHTKWRAWHWEAPSVKRGLHTVKPLSSINGSGSSPVTYRYVTKDFAMDVSGAKLLRHFVFLPCNFSWFIVTQDSSSRHKAPLTWIFLFKKVCDCIGVLKTWPLNFFFYIQMVVTMTVNESEPTVCLTLFGLR